MNTTIAQNIVMNELPEPLKPLAAWPQFIVCLLVPSKITPGKTDKYPIDHRTAQVANALNPDIWLDADTAISTARLFGSEYRVGFVFTEKDPFFFLDIDNCLLADGVTWSPLALELIGMLPGAAVEISQSGRGLHVFGSYSGEMPEHACKNIQLGIELYHKDRFVVLTGVV